MRRPLLVALALLVTGCASSERTQVHAADAAQVGSTSTVDYEVGLVRLELRREYLRRAASCPLGRNDCTARAEAETLVALRARKELADQAVAESTESRALLEQAANCPGLDPACVKAALDAAGIAASRAATDTLRLHLTRPEAP